MWTGVAPHMLLPLVQTCLFSHADLSVHCLCLRDILTGFSLVQEYVFSFVFSFTVLLKCSVGIVYKCLITVGLTRLCSQDGTVKVWHYESGRRLHSVDLRKFTLDSENTEEVLTI